MTMLENFNCKDCSTEETIERYSKFFENLGCNFEIQITEAINGVWWATIRGSNNSLHSNGKGLTQQQAEASAWGEVVERLSTSMASIQDEPIRKFSLSGNREKTSEFLRSFVSENTGVSQDILYMYNYKIPADVDIDLDDVINYESQKREYIGVEKGYSIKKDKIIQIPFRYLVNLSSSTGMASGNTPEEALVEALSEICERYADLNVRAGGWTPPTIPEEVLWKEVPELMKRFYDLGRVSNCEIKVLDLSLGLGLPVLGFLLIRKDTKEYKFQAGAHPLFRIAFERCITELYQGVNNLRTIDRDWWASFNKEEDELVGDGFNFEEGLTRRKGSISLDVFKKNSSYEFKNVFFSGEYTNKKGISYLLNLLKKQTDDIIIKDCSILGFPAYYVYVTKFSTVPANKGEIDDISVQASNILARRTKEIVDFTEQERDLIRIALRDFYRYGSKTPVDKEIIEAACLLDDGLEEQALKVLKRYSRKKPLTVGSIIRDIELSQEGVSEEDRDYMLSTFYSEVEVKNAKLWRLPNRLLMLFIVKKKSEESSTSVEDLDSSKKCSSEDVAKEIDERCRNIQKVVDQTEIQKLVKEWLEI